MMLVIFDRMLSVYGRTKVSMTNLDRFDAFVDLNPAELLLRLELPGPQEEALTVILRGPLDELVALRRERSEAVVDAVFDAWQVRESGRWDLLNAAGRARLQESNREALRRARDVDETTAVAVRLQITSIMDLISGLVTSEEAADLDRMADRARFRADFLALPWLAGLGQPAAEDPNVRADEARFVATLEAIAEEDPAGSASESVLLRRTAVARMEQSVLRAWIRSELALEAAPE